MMDAMDPWPKAQTQDPAVEHQLLFGFLGRQLITPLRERLAQPHTPRDGLSPGRCSTRSVIGKKSTFPLLSGD